MSHRLVAGTACCAVTPHIQPNESVTAIQIALTLRCASPKRDDMAIDLMIVDVVMPDMSGPDLAERVLVIWLQMKVLFIEAR